MNRQNLPSTVPYTMILKIVNNKPLLIIPHHTHHKKQQSFHQFTPMAGSQNPTYGAWNRRSIKKNERMSADKMYKGVCNFSNGMVTPNGKSQSLEYSKQQIQRGQLSQSRLTKQSLIQQLSQMNIDLHNSMVIKTEAKHLTSFQFIETNSFDEDGSDSDQDHLSQIVELTAQQRLFFNHFIHETETDNVKQEPQQQLQPFTMLQLMPKVKGHHRTLSCKDEYPPTDKKKVIRNFFRSKGSMIKDEKTCCNSQVFLEEMSRKRKGMAQSGSEEDEEQRQYRMEF